MRKYSFIKLVYNKLLIYILSSFAMTVSAGSNLQRVDSNLFFTLEQSLGVIVIKGRVTDGEGKALQNVMVLLKERAKVVKTDSNGEFIIAGHIKENLEFSCAGFKSKTMKISEEIVIIKLKKL